MLHLLARLEVVPARRLLGLDPDPVTATERRQSLVGDLCPLSLKLLVDSHEVAPATRVQLQDLVAVGLGFLPPERRRWLPASGGDHLLDAVAGDLQ